MVPAILLLDRAFGEPPARWHPVAWFGRLGRAVERRVHADSVARGAAYAIVLCAGSAAVGVALDRAAVRLTDRRGAAALIAGTVCVAGRMLADQVGAVATALDDDDLDTARDRIGRLVGRDTTRLDADGIARAAVETMAENTVDAVTAPLFWVAIGGAPAVIAHRGINTLDAMIGHRSLRYERFGKFAARVDDVANWLPARLTALAVAVARPLRASEVVRVVRRDARRHPSPNGGVAESAFAAALGVSLGGVNSYAGRVEDRGTLGDGRPPSSHDVRLAVVLARTVWWVMALELMSGRMLAVRRGWLRGGSTVWPWPTRWGRVPTCPITA